MARHCNPLRRWPLQQHIASHVERNLSAVSRRLILFGPYPCPSLSIGQLEQHARSSVRFIVHQLCSRENGIDGGTNQRGRGMSKLSSWQLERHCWSVFLFSVHPVRGWSDGFVCRSDERRGWLSALSRAFVLPWRECCSGVQYWRILSDRHVHGQSALPTGKLLCKYEQSSELPIGTLWCRHWTHCRDGLRSMRSRQIWLTGWTNQFRCRMHRLRSGHLWRHRWTHFRCQLHELSRGATRTDGRSVDGSSGLSIVYRRILLPRWKCTGRMRRRCLLPGRHADCQSALSTGILLRIHEYDCRLPTGTLWRCHTAHGGNWMHGVRGWQIRSSGRCDDGSCRLYQLPIGHVGQCACIGGTQLMHQLCGRHRRCVCGSKHRRRRMHRVCRRFLLPRWNQSSDLQRGCLLPVGHQCGESAMRTGILLCVAVESSGLPIGTLWCRYTAHRRNGLRGLCGRQIRSIGWPKHCRCRMHRLCPGHLWCHHGPVLRWQLHAVCRRPARTDGRSVDGSSGLSIVYRRILLPRWKCTGRLCRRILLSGGHKYSGSALSSRAVLRISLDRGGLSRWSLWPLHWRHGGVGLRAMCGRQIWTGGRSNQ